MYNQQIVIILDACRFDYFQKAKNPFTGTLTKKNTGCSTTFQWYKKYWQQKTDYHLISENPQPWHKNSNKAHQNFKTSYPAFANNWLKVDPLKTLQYFAKVKQPNEKYLIHFLPPHLPFVFGAGAKLMQKLNYNALNVYEAVQAWGQQGNNHLLLKQYYQQQIDGMLQLLWDNLEMFSDYETMVITSDHAEIVAGFAEKMYAHPPKPNAEQAKLLHSVPYFEVNVFDNLLEKHLQRLGYTE